VTTAPAKPVEQTPVEVKAPAVAGGAKPKFDKAAMLEKIRQKKAEKGQ